MLGLALEVGSASSCDNCMLDNCMKIAVYFLYLYNEGVSLPEYIRGIFDVVKSEFSDKGPGCSESNGNVWNSPIAVPRWNLKWSS